MTEALRIDGLRFAWPGSAWVLAIPQLRLDAGERLFLHGPSGTGKSTLLNLVAGTLLPQAGAVRVAGEDVATRSGPARDRLRADHLGIVFQQFNLLPFLSMIDNVTLPCRFSSRRRERALQRFGSLDAAARHYLAALGLGDAAQAKRRVIELSVGQQQRVAAARALIGGPSLVLCDEPTSALDTRNRDQFIELLFAECEAAGTALLFVSHDLSLAARLPRQQALGELSTAGAEAPEAAA
ncbi:MAG: ABC transporter ATP-binding protein [Silanimonas sp.]